MDSGEVQERSARRRRLGRPVSIFALLTVALCAVFSGAESDFAVEPSIALAPLTAQSQVRQKPPSEGLGARADGGIDSFENDDLSCEPQLPPLVQRAESSAASSSPALRLAGGQLARTYPARGPPSA